MVLLIADSVCGGFGQPGKKSFVHLAANELNLKVWDHSASGMTTEDYLGFLKNGKRVSKEQDSSCIKGEGVDCVIVSLGNVDAKGVFSKNNFLSKFVPGRYRREKIDPRPYFSKKKIKKFLQHSEDCLRTLIRNYLFLTGNLSPKCSLSEYSKNIKEILSLHDDANVILVSTSVVSAKKFPGTEERFRQVNLFLESMCDGERLFYFDLESLLSSEMLFADGFHLNEEGHKKIVSCFREQLYRVISG